MFMFEAVFSYGGLSYNFVVYVCGEYAYPCKGLAQSLSLPPLFVNHGKCLILIELVIS